MREDLDLQTRGAREKEEQPSASSLARESSPSLRPAGSMAGLSVVLETHKNCPGKPQIVSKTSLHNRCTNKLAASASSFLQRCFLCHQELARDRDIYMYRGDRAFCSEECRRRHIFMDEDAGGVSCCAKGATTVRGSRPTGGGGFAY